MTDKTKILVTGATGYIGGRLVPRLMEQHYTVRCMARDPARLSGRAWTDVECVAGDALQADSLAKPLAGIDTAYYLIHSMSGGESGFRQRDRQAAQNFAAVAQDAGIKRIIYLGGLGGQEQVLSPHLRSRQEVGDILRSSGIPVTEFRAAVIVGSGSLSFEMIRYLTERLPVMICPRWLLSKCQPIAVRDILAYLLAALTHAASSKQIIEVGGSDVLTYADMIKQYAQVRGLKRLLIHVPVLTPRLSSYWVDLVTPIPAVITHPLIEGLRNDVLCHDQRAREIFPEIQPLTFYEAVRLALQRVEEGQVETIWSGSYAALGPGMRSVNRLKTKEGMIIETRLQKIRAPSDKIYKICCGIGGQRGWFYANWLWCLRGWLDRLWGGVGMRRGRRDPNTLRQGDALDFWRVEAVESNKLIRLRAEMKVPGEAWLQFEVEAAETDESVLTQTAFFDPKGLWGFLYWYLLYPIHHIIFSGLSRSIQKRAELSPSEIAIG